MKTAQIIEFDKRERSKDTEPPERRIAHQWLDVILNEGVPNSPEFGDGTFGQLLYVNYHAAQHSRLEKHKRFKEIDSEDYTGPRFTLRLIFYEDPGFILRVDDFVSFERGRTLCSRPRGGQTVGYTVQRIQKGLTTVAIYFQYVIDGDPYWCRQLIDVDRSRNRFLCPLCSDSVSELFMSGHPVAYQEHFGCVTCTTTFMPEQMEYVSLSREEGAL